MSIFYKQTIKCRTTESAWRVDTEKTNQWSASSWWEMEALSETLGGVRLTIKKDQRLSFLSNSALGPATVWVQGLMSSTPTPSPHQLLQLMVQPVNQTQPKAPSPWSAT